jgi:hypothetical protein
MFDNSLAMFNENSGAVYNAIEFRRNFGAHTNNLAGVMGYGDFLCSVSGANISIAAGSAYVADIGGASFGQYFARTTSFALANTIVRTPNNSGVARNDCVYIRILDTTRGDSIDSCDLVYEANASTPSAPRALLLATIAVSGLNVAVATDARKFSGTYQGIYRTTVANLTVPTDGGPRYAHILDTNLTQQYDAVRNWHPLAAGIPHASTAKSNPALFALPSSVVANNVWASIPSSPCVLSSFQKYRTDTKLIFQAALSLSTAAGRVDLGVQFNFVDYLVSNFFTNVAGNRFSFSGIREVTGILAGTYLAEVRVRRGDANNINFFTNDDFVHLMVTETF